MHALIHHAAMFQVGSRPSRLNRVKLITSKYTGTGAMVVHHLAWEQLFVDSDFTIRAEMILSTAFCSFNFPE